MKRIIIFLLLPISCFSQGNFNGTWITKGLILTSGKWENDNILFTGSNLHEGGYMLLTKIKNDSTLIVIGRSPDEIGVPSYITDNNCYLLLKKVEGFTLLLILNKDSVLKDLLQKVDDDAQLYNIAVENKINYQLAGNYLISNSDDSIIFYPYQSKVKGLTDESNYTFETEYDYIINVISFPKKSFYYEKEYNRLLLYEAFKDENNEFKKGKLFETLILLSRFNLSNKNIPGEFSFASTIPLTDDILEYYSLNELRIMRNEIFARYGYIFNSKDLSSYFLNQPWYKPLTHDVNSKLTELEKINIQLLKEFEVSYGK